ncbi:MAG TPA: SGNH/GDSL hydrolase family protein [Trebonia sp.]|nr:SGNH/GDSL hydrolase family protein [Trebonia sp.]
MLAQSDALAACERRLESTGRGIPAMAIVGASYTAGVGPRDPELSWAVQLARALRWNAVIDGVSGAGYVRPGAGRQGPVARLLAREGLAALGPALVIVQAGHDDAGVPPGIERDRVRQAVALIRAEAPHALIALLTVFTGRSPSPPARLFQTDAAIVAGALAADPGAIIMDPLAGHWDYQHFNGGLHPTAAGDTWIAGKVAKILRAHGVLPATGGREPMICVAAAGVGAHRGGDAVTAATGDRRSDA